MTGNSPFGPVPGNFHRWQGAGVLALLLLGGSLLFWWRPWASPPPNLKPTAPAPRKEFPLAPLSASPFRNAKPEAQYVGSETCVSCHQGRTASFRTTGMGISMAVVDPETAPPDSEFKHAPSRRKYQVARKEGQLWHSEWSLEDADKESLLTSYPVKYVVGSGHHAYTYLVEAEGFLVESPITWYTSKKKWDMSPGYDRPDHQSFERGVGELCLFCHAGKPEPVGKSLHRMHLKELAIGCERCHGPGSVHVALHTSPNKQGLRPELDMDDTIVNPIHLARELSEAICQQCHLQTDVMVLNRGRKLFDFRPGLPLEDFRQDYRLEQENKPMTVVGHVEQMHLSRCYKESATLTCITCHNPHAPPPPDKLVPYYQKKCFQCHEPESCNVEKEVLRKESPQNDCVQCHMPQSATEVTHVSFTHHLIGIHKKPSRETEEISSLAVLRPFKENPRLSKWDKKRSLGLAYWELANQEKNPDRVTQYKKQAFHLLSEAHKAGLRDSASLAKLARLHFEQGMINSMALAEEALFRPDITGSDLCTALFIQGAERFKRKQLDAALESFSELVELRRHPHDWLLLADTEKMLGRFADGRKSLKMAFQISPRLSLQMTPLD